MDFAEEDGLLAGGVRVPEDTAIVGLDDIGLASRRRVPLTTIIQPVADIGTRSVDIVLARMRGEHPPVRQLMPPTMVVRASSVQPATAAARAVAVSEGAAE